MHRLRSAIVGMALMGLLAGCGGTSVDEGPKPFTPTDTTEFKNTMIKDMQDQMKKGDYRKVQQPPPEKSKESEKKK